MRKVFISSVLGLMVSVSALFAENAGQGIFETNGCSMCHKPDMETVGPSLKQISMYYSGKENTLLSYLKGETGAIIYPERAGVMKPQLIKIRNLYEDETRALARYLITPQF